METLHFESKRIDCLSPTIKIVAAVTAWFLHERMNWSSLVFQRMYAITINV